MEHRYLVCSSSYHKEAGGGQVGNRPKRAQGRRPSSRQGRREADKRFKPLDDLRPKSHCADCGKNLSILDSRIREFTSS